MQVRSGSWLFGLVVALCLAQIGWWIFFQVREAGQVERAARSLAAGDITAAARALDLDAGRPPGEQSRRRRVMFLSEGVALSLLVLAGIVLFFRQVQRERRLYEAQERFLAGATHELKTPLATLRLGLESLQGQRLAPERQAHYLATMLGEVARLENDVVNLLTAANVAAGPRPMARRLGRLDQDVDAVLAETRPRFEAAGIELRAALEPIELTRDPDAVRIIVRNLLDNAVKFCDRGDHVTVTVARTAEHAELVVADNGPGMSASESAQVFERFYRGPGKDHVGGTGLGLHLVAALTKAHGGTVTAASAGLGQGSEFRVRLPLVGGRS